MSVSISGQSTDGSLQSNPSSSTKLVNSSLKDVYTASQYLEAATRAIIEAANNGTWREVASKYYVSTFPHDPNLAERSAFSAAILETDPDCSELPGYALWWISRHGHKSVGRWAMSAKCGGVSSIHGQLLTPLFQI